MTKQLNVKVSDAFYLTGAKFAQKYGYRNIQDAMVSSFRDKLSEMGAFDNSFSKKEISLIDEFIDKSIKGGKLGSENKLMKALK
jgi:hypothetical protein